MSVQPVVRFERSEELPPGSGNFDWNEIREALFLHKIEKGVIPDPDEPEPEKLEVTEWGHYIGANELPGAAKSLALKAEKQGWDIACSRSKTHKPAVRYQKDSEEGAEPSYKRGDILYEASDREHYELRGQKSAGGQTVAFRVLYMSKDGKNSFEAAWHHDPISGTVYESKATGFNNWLKIVLPTEVKKKTGS